MDVNGRLNKQEEDQHDQVVMDMVHRDILIIILMMIDMVKVVILHGFHHHEVEEADLVQIDMDQEAVEVIMVVIV